MSLPHVLLGLLSRGPASGWDLKTRLSREPSLAWDADLAQIYPALQRLLRGGFISLKQRRSIKGPARREYRVTSAGKREFLEWLVEPPELPRPKDAQLARLSFLERLSVNEKIERLKKIRALVKDGLKKSGPGTTAARRRRRALLETELRWIEAELALAAIEGQASQLSLDDTYDATR